MPDARPEPGPEKVQGANVSFSFLSDSGLFTVVRIQSHHFAHKWGDGAVSPATVSRWSPQFLRTRREMSRPSRMRHPPTITGGHGRFTYSHRAPPASVRPTPIRRTRRTHPSGTCEDPWDPEIPIRPCQFLFSFEWDPLSHSNLYLEYNSGVAPGGWFGT